jgi:hypothetical protein
MWGQCDLDTQDLSFSNPDDPTVSLPVYEVSEPPTPRYELVGRSTWPAEVKLVTPADETSDDMSTEDLTPKFLKLSWPEVQRVPEYDIIHTAHSRAGQVEEYSGIEEMVKKHIPKVLGYKNYPHTSTAIIRRLLLIPTDGARVLRTILFKKLKPLISLDPRAVCGAYWDILLCMCFSLSNSWSRIDSPVIKRPCGTVETRGLSRRHQCLESHVRPSDGSRNS